MFLTHTAANAEESAIAEPAQAAVTPAIINSTGAGEDHPPTIAIIIDDMGNYQNMGERAIRIPAPLTLSFLPFRPHTNSQARLAYAAGKEIMLHIPMENVKRIPLGASGLTSDMSSQNMVATFRQAIKAIPYVSGVNNHMGSALTQNRAAMNLVMGELQGYPLYFVDSRTTASSVAHAVAANHAIPTLNRDVFLDHVITTKAIDFQFKRLLDIARKKGTAIAIGHPHRETIEYLEKVLPSLGEQGVAIATIKGLWAIRNNAQDMFQTTPPTILAERRKGNDDEPKKSVN
ncbi:divergent polysaccharide deacetylase family protein [Hahella chejuensis]|uniref:divergent polysaccharide deacetylase family protein n=1 Tax=Hahella chejuensis TaxID=158327 RepID=UPI0002D9475C|nr:divergent polysaccharide deacetylase family protein [Hahella chejuensis]